MKREGPCYHCGISYTPLWRNGPPEKPVLCNACGSRWRMRGTLADYVPKHAIKDNQNRKPKYIADITEPDLTSDCFEDDATNKSSSGSIASSETCSHTENINGSDEPKIWDRESIPRRKRSVLNQWVFSPVERLHKDLLHVMYQQDCLSQSEDEDVLIYENTNLFSSPPETAYGAMLLKPPNPATNENKPESPSTKKENKPEPPLPEKENKPGPPLPEKENKPEPPLPEKESKPESPLPEKENKPEPPLPEKENKPEPPLPEKENKPEPPLLPPLLENENKPESPLPEKENKPKIPLQENENKPDYSLTEKENKPESPLTENKTYCSTDASLDQLSSKSISQSNPVAQTNEYSPSMRTRRSRGYKHSAGHMSTCYMDSLEESNNDLKDVYIHPIPTAEFRAAFPARTDRDQQLKCNQKPEERVGSNSGRDGCIEEEAELFDIPLFSAMDLGSEIVPPVLLSFNSG